MLPANIPSGVSFRFIQCNGIRLRIAEAGTEGPLLVLAHGWPESWYSWRHQILPLAAAGFRVVAPDMRGFGESDAPAEINDYDIEHLANDMVGIIDNYGEQQATIIGHDWGAIVAWQSVLLHPSRFHAVIALSVPHFGRSKRSPIDIWKESYGDRFFYILYHQQPGIADAEYDTDPEGLLSRLYLSPDTPRLPAENPDKDRRSGGWIKRLGAPTELPSWLSQADLDYYIARFRLSGFRGGLNYYRNFHRNWLITPQLAGARVDIPALFIAGEKDMVIRGMDKEQLVSRISRVATDLRDVILFPRAGHWIQQELPENTNAAVLQFLTDIYPVP